MKNNRSFFQFLLVLNVFAWVTLATPDLVWSYSSGPPDGVAGDPPGNATCTQCHATYPLNSGSGALQILDFPAEYRPDSTYAFTITLEDAGQLIWGFEMTVILDNGDRGGVLAAVDPLVQISQGAGSDRDYAKQTTQGNFRNQASATWDLQWTAPPENSGQVTFYLAGNAADLSSSTSGDYVYAVDYPLPEEILGVAHNGQLAQRSYFLQNAYPNPFNPNISLELTGLPAGEVNVAVLNLEGRIVRELRVNSLGAAHMIIPLNMADLPSGNYFVRTHYNGGSAVTPITRIK